MFTGLKRRRGKKNDEDERTNNRKQMFDTTQRARGKSCTDEKKATTTTKTQLNKYNHRRQTNGRSVRGSHRIQYKKPAQHKIYVDIGIVLPLHSVLDSVCMHRVILPTPKWYATWFRNHYLCARLLLFDKINYLKPKHNIPTTHPTSATTWPAHQRIAVNAPDLCAWNEQRRIKLGCFEEIDSRFGCLLFFSSFAIR